MSTLTVGSSGNDVVELQARLAFLQLYTAQLSGHFDAAVEDAVRSYQAHHGLNASGEADHDTIEHLRAKTDAEGFVLAAGEQQMQADPVIGTAGPSVFNEKMKTSLRHVSDRLVGLSAEQAAAVLRAVDAFEEYAQGRMKDFHKSPITLSDYAKYTVRFFMDEGGVAIAKVLPPWAKVVFVPLSMAYSRALATSMKKWIESDEEDLMKVIKALKIDVPTSLNAAQEQFKKDLDAAFSTIIQRLNFNEPLDPADEEWLSQFYDFDTHDLDKLIERVLGFPASSTETELRIYQQLVETFEHEYLDKLEGGKGSVIFPAREDAHEKYEREREQARKEKDREQREHDAGKRAADKRRERLVTPQQHETDQ